MKWNLNRELSKGLRIAAIAIVVTGSVAAPAAYAASTAYAASSAYATPANDPIVAPPMDMPEMSRLNGEAKLPQATPDAKTLPYIEHDQRARPNVQMRDKARDEQEFQLGIASAG